MTVVFGSKTKCVAESGYGVATDSRIDKIIGFFCRIISLLQGSFTLETYHFIDPTNQSHPIVLISLVNCRFISGKQKKTIVIHNNF